MTGAAELDEVDWLKSRLESLEDAILAHGSGPEEPSQPSPKATTPGLSNPASNDLPPSLATSVMEAPPVVPLMVATAVAEDCSASQDMIAGRDARVHLSAGLQPEDSPELSLRLSGGQADGVVPSDDSHISSALTSGAMHTEVSSSDGEEAARSTDDELGLYEVGSISGSSASDTTE